MRKLHAAMHLDTISTIVGRDFVLPCPDIINHSQAGSRRPISKPGGRGAAQESVQLARNGGRCMACPIIRDAAGDRKRRRCRSNHRRGVTA